ncbi:hypothetical protein N7510_002030 [Penicillium lagena]|uniref:uncharacterized protein n=1 Tax=Penicillium lagena TaxID=94218 RepID=UPI002540B039|nr:uncharacterized protein N7510_002030 [Penicillium lagena]KAJ5625721.1 hypothetical protein N7510_002030 [Penicillium lagena]
MSISTAIQRALLFPLRWKQRLSTSNTKEKEIEFFDDNSDHADMNFDSRDIQTSSPALECDVSNTAHLAVKSGLGTNTGLFPGIDNFKHIELDVNSIPEEEGDFEDKSQSLPPGINLDPSARSRLFRAVSWANIVRSQYRWTQEQEQQLKLAMKELTRCQKAWNSEQELWLTQIPNTDDYFTNPAKVQALSDEKKAHQCFLLMRNRQQDDERHQFRKSWRKRVSVH